MVDGAFGTEYSCEVDASLEAGFMERNEGTWDKRFYLAGLEELGRRLKGCKEKLGEISIAHINAQNEKQLDGVFIFLCTDSVCL